MSIEQKLRALATRWATAAAAERANAQSYLIELCDALEVEKPRPAGSGYEFEYPVRVVNRDGTETTNFVDCFKRGHFILEAKDQGTTADDTILLRKAYGQARAYTAAADGGPPPYALVLDVGRTLLVWDRWSGTYGGFNAGTRINLATLADNPDSIALLRDIFERPDARNPNVRSAAVTKEIAEQLAELAAALEARGFEHERIARFLIRCVFTMFAEDTGLIPDSPFTHAIDEIGFADPDEFAVALAGLWKAMDEGSRFGLKKFLRFNGHFFKDQEVLPLTIDDLTILRRAAAASWEDVEPSIMGTLLVRALDPVERHRLGAEYTPREYVERVVRPTVEEPIRERWTAVQADVLQLRDSAGLAERTRRDRDKQAVDRLRGYHEWLRGLRFLDPACGSGNFLYVTLAIVKQIELEVLRGIEEITGAPELAVEEVGPWQFHGIEVKLWAREIAELSLWIGYHQWWRRTHGHTQPPEPVLRDTGTLECRDAVLAWDLGEAGELRNARETIWPEADFIVGNPPYMGFSRMRAEFGDEYVNGLRLAYGDRLNPSVDYVMYWWFKAARAVAEGRTMRAGLITTNSIRQSYNRSVIERAEADGARVIWAVRDHPWIDGVDGAAVRVAMTVLSAGRQAARLVTVSEAGIPVAEARVSSLNADLTAQVDVATVARIPLLSNGGISSRGFQLRGRGFLIDGERASLLRRADPSSGAMIRPFLNGRDLAQRPRGLSVIDFAEQSLDEARLHPPLLDHLRLHVKPERENNRIARLRDVWWQFGINMVGLREALEGLERYIATPYVSRHRFFTFLPAEVAPDDTIVAVASDDPFILGVLSSRIHAVWADAAGTRLGVGNDFRYNNPTCFKAFAFPDPDEGLRSRIGAVADRIDAQRKSAMAADDRVTITSIYNVIGKVRGHEELSELETELYTVAGCGVLQEFHDELDELVARAYGWDPALDEGDILQALVSLHDARVEEEARGRVLWVRRAYQSANETPVPELELAQGEAVAAETANAPSEWPPSTLEQIRSLQALISSAPHTVEEATRAFRGGRRDIISRHLETLVLLGEAKVGSDGAYELLPTAP